MLKLDTAWKKKQGAEIAQWLERQTRDRKVNVLCRLLFWSHSTPPITTVVCKRSWSFWQRCRWQVTAKHTCTSHMRLCMTRCMVVWCTRNMLRQQQFDMAPSHVTTKISVVSTPLRWIFKMRCKWLQLLIQNHIQQQECSESAREWRTILCKSDQQEEEYVSQSGLVVRH